MSLIKVNFLGKELDNPFILASAPPTKDLESIIKGYKAGWAGVITKSICENPLTDKTPRIAHIKYKGKIIASQNYEMGSIHEPEYWVSTVNEVKELYPDKLLYISLFGSQEVSEWINTARIFKNTKTDGFELNFSCPHADHEGKGYVIGQKPDLCSELTRAVKSVLGDDKKIIVKLTNSSYPNEGYIASKCIEAGADGISGINTIAGLCEINADTLEPELNTGGMTTYGGMSGEIIRPFARASIANICKSIDYNKHQVSAMGGVSSDNNAMIEYMLLGATTIQVCTEVMNKGYQIINDLIKNLESYLNRHETTLSKIKGCGLDSITDWFSLNNIKRISKVDYDKCTKCYTCLPFCNYDAITKDEVGIIINEEECDGCGSCVSACNSNALKMIPKSRG